MIDKLKIKALLDSTDGTMAEIGRQLGCSDEYVRRVGIAFGINIKLRGHRCTISRRPRRRQKRGLVPLEIACPACGSRYRHANGRCADCGNFGQGLPLRFWPYLDRYAEGDQLLRVINQAIPRTIPEGIRADVCQDAAVAVLEGKARRESLNVRLLLKNWWKSNSPVYRSIRLESLL